MVKKIFAQTYLWILLLLLYSPIVIIVIYSFTEAKVLGNCVVYPAERTQIGLRVEVLVFDIHVVRFGGVEPPGIHTQVEDVIFHCFPVDVPCCRITQLGISQFLSMPMIQ